MEPDSGERGKEGIYHFVLVHGAGHGAWCWYRVSDLLKKAGHIVTTVDLAGSGLNPKDADAIRSFAEYNEPLVEIMKTLPDEDEYGDGTHQKKGKGYRLFRYLEPDSGERGKEGIYHFVLVHGAGHGAWCWYRVSDLLKKAGHIVTPVDLAGSGLNPKDADAIRSFAEYNEPLVEIMKTLPDEDEDGDGDGTHQKKGKGYRLFSN